MNWVLNNIEYYNPWTHHIPPFIQIFSLLLFVLWIFFSQMCTCSVRHHVIGVFIDGNFYISIDKSSLLIYKNTVERDGYCGAYLWFQYSRGWSRLIIIVNQTEVHTEIPSQKTETVEVTQWQSIWQDPSLNLHSHTHTHTHTHTHKDMVNLYPKTLLNLFFNSNVFFNRFFKIFYIDINVIFSRDNFSSFL
jgi:hypothetical protein